MTPSPCDHQWAPFALGTVRCSRCGITMPATVQQASVVATGANGWRQIQGGAVPEPEPWMRPGDYERYLRHLREGT